MTEEFDDLNTGDLFRFAHNPRGDEQLVYRKADQRCAVQQRADGKGDLHSVDAMVKTRPAQKVQRVDPKATTNADKAAELLRQAARSIETALVLLDMRETKCSECCTKRHWANPLHAKTYQQFTNTPHSLKTAAQHIESEVGNVVNQVALSAKEQ